MHVLDEIQQQTLFVLQKKTKDTYLYFICDLEMYFDRQSFFGQILQARCDLCGSKQSQVHRLPLAAPKKQPVKHTNKRSGRYVVMPYSNKAQQINNNINNKQPRQSYVRCRSAPEVYYLWSPANALSVSPC